MVQSGDPLDGAVEHRHHLVDVTQQLFAARGQRDAAAVALKQGGVEGALELLDRDADRGLADAKRSGRAGHASGAGDLSEVAQLGEVHGARVSCLGGTSLELLPTPRVPGVRIRWGRSADPRAPGSFRCRRRCSARTRRGPHAAARWVKTLGCRPEGAHRMRRRAARPETRPHRCARKGAPIPMPRRDGTLNPSRPWALPPFWRTSAAPFPSGPSSPNVPTRLNDTGVTVRRSVGVDVDDRKRGRIGARKLVGPHVADVGDPRASAIVTALASPSSSGL